MLPTIVNKPFVVRFVKVVSLYSCQCQSDKAGRFRTFNLKIDTKMGLQCFLYIIMSTMKMVTEICKSSVKQN